MAGEYQGGTNELRVLLPAGLQPGRRYPTLYLLPVYAGDEPAAEAMEAARALDLHNRHQLICVAPAFERLPWYADHPDDARVRQESHLLKLVLPFVERNYPARSNADDRLLVGFSKSGWGAFSLLLRHPEVFGRAASWDAPLMMERPGKYGSEAIFGRQENFENYRITRLLELRAGYLRSQPARLVLLGYGNFAEDDTLLHQRLESSAVPHHWEHGPKRRHDWDSGWLARAVELLMHGLEAK